jgi:hypothetical protein
VTVGARELIVQLQHRRSLSAPSKEPIFRSLKGGLKTSSRSHHGHTVENRGRTKGKPADPAERRIQRGKACLKLIPGRVPWVKLVFS